MMISKENLMYALTIGGALAGKNKVVPIFEYVKCEVKGKDFIVTSNDSECEAKYRVPYEESECDFAFCVIAKDFISTVKSIKDDNVSLVIDGETLLIKHSKGVAHLPTTDANVFPVNVRDGVAEQLVMPSDKLVEWIKTSQNFVGKDDLRPIMSGMFMRVKPSLIEVCATDAHKMFCDEFTLVDDFAPFEAVIPARCFGALLNILNTCEKVEVFNYEKNIEFLTDFGAIVCRKIEGNFPNFRAVIPQTKPNDGCFNVSKADFIESVSRAGMFTDVSTARLKLEVTDGKLHINGTNVDFCKYADEYLNVGSNSNFEISLKADYLLSCLNSIIDDNVIAWVISPDRPIIFEDGARQGKIILQMPMVG
jgi:DNA polymerase-3 subunit beta